MALIHIGQDLTILNLLKNHISNAANVYPTLADGEQVVGGAGAWELGSFKEIVPAGGITDLFMIHYINIEAASVADVYEIVIYAATVEIGRVRVSFIDVANSQTLPSVPFTCGVMPASTQIQAKCATKGGGLDTVDISLAYHTH